MDQTEKKEPSNRTEFRDMSETIKIIFEVVSILIASITALTSFSAQNWRWFLASIFLIVCILLAIFTFRTKKVNDKKEYLYPKARPWTLHFSILFSILFLGTIIFRPIDWANWLYQKFATPTETPTPTLTFTVTPSITATQTSTFTPTPSQTQTLTPTSSCPYASNTDDETIRALIALEAEAVNRKSIDMILAIFTADAVFADYAVPDSQPPHTWFGPMERYKEDLFKTSDLRDVANMDILPAGPGIFGDAAYYTSGSKGYYKSGDVWISFYNGSIVGEQAPRYGSNHWTLRRGPNGCWAIVRFDFNAGHIPFPP